MVIFRHHHFVTGGIKQKSTQCKKEATERKANAFRKPMTLQTMIDRCHRWAFFSCGMTRQSRNQASPHANKHETIIMTTCKTG